MRHHVSSNICILFPLLEVEFVKRGQRAKSTRALLRLGGPFWTTAISFMVLHAFFVQGMGKQTIN